MYGTPAGLPLIVTLPDDIDVTNSGVAFGCVLTALDNPGLVIADMTGTTFCDCSGLRMLMTARDHARATGATLRIAIKPGSYPARSLAVLGIDQALPVYASIKDVTPASPPAPRPPSFPRRVRKAESPERQPQT